MNAYTQFDAIQFIAAAEFIGIWVGSDRGSHVDMLANLAEVVGQDFVDRHLVGIIAIRDAAYHARRVTLDLNFAPGR